MSALNDSSHSGVFSFLLGLGLLVIVATGFDLMAEESAGADRKMELFELEMQLMRGRDQIRNLHSQIASLEAKNIALDQRARSISIVPELRDEFVVRQGLRNAFYHEVKDLSLDIQVIQDEWIQYRHSRRRSAKLSLQGNFFRKIKENTGREYWDVLVQKVELDRIKIRYRGGVAEIPFDQLPENLREDLDLMLDETETALNKERAKESARRHLIEKTLILQRQAEASVENTKQISELASPQLRAEKRKVDQMVRQMYFAQAEASRARSNDVFSPKRSVTGSEEPWSDRAHRMDQAAESFRSKINRAVREMTKLDPNYRPPSLD